MPTVTTSRPARTPSAISIPVRLFVVPASSLVCAATVCETGGLYVYTGVGAGGDEAGSAAICAWLMVGDVRII